MLSETEREKGRKKDGERERERARESESEWLIGADWTVRSCSLLAGSRYRMSSLHTLPVVKCMYMYASGSAGVEESIPSLRRRDCFIRRKGANYTNTCMITYVWKTCSHIFLSFSIGHLGACSQG